MCDGLRNKYHTVVLIISAAKRTALVSLRFAYNLMRMRLRVGFIESIEKWIESENLKNLPFDCHPVAWSKRVGTEIELFKVDGRVISRDEFRLLFCRKGTKVIEIFTAFWIAPCFYAI